MTLHESMNVLLEDIRNSDIFKTIDFHKLIRELYEIPDSSICGIGIKEINSESNRIYNYIMDTYDQIPIDQKPEKAEYFESALKTFRKNGYEQTSILLSIMFASRN